MEQDTEPNQQVKDALHDALTRGTIFEELSNQKGWELVKAYITNKVRNFSNKAITQGFTNLEEFNLERGEVKGLMGLLTHIDNDLRTLNEERSKKQNAEPTTTE